MPTSTRYRVKAPKGWPDDQPPFGIEYQVAGKLYRAEAGEIATDVPAHSVGTCSEKCPHPRESRGWLLDQGLVEEVG